nr:MAG TPA: YopX protein [Caudoviricetes sp.]
MRQILFKAKRKDNGKWVEGYYQKRFDLDGSEQHLIFWSKSYTVWEYAEINPDTICQYTGLTDKNGKRIWENDICDRKEKYSEIVTYNKGDWQLDYSYVFGKEMHTDACNLGFYVCERDCVEVIGNIFDNADLLEVK